MLKPSYGHQKNAKKLSNTIQNVTADVPIPNERGPKLKLQLETGFSSILEHSSSFLF